VALAVCSTASGLVGQIATFGQAQVLNLGGGTTGTMSTTSGGNLGCDLNWTVSGATPNALGFFAAGMGSTSIPLSAVFPGCPGTIHTPNPAFASIPLDASGGASLTLQTPPNQALCGQSVTCQYVEFQVGPCLIALTDAIAITIGT